MTLQIIGSSSAYASKIIFTEDWFNPLRHPGRYRLLDFFSIFGKLIASKNFLVKKFLRIFENIDLKSTFSTFFSFCVPISLGETLQLRIRNF